MWVLIKQNRISKLKNKTNTHKKMASLVAQMVKNIRLQCGRCRFNTWVGKIPWRREWLPTLVLLPGKSHGQRSLVGYGPWGHKVSDMTEQLTFYLSNYYPSVLSFPPPSTCFLLLEREIKEQWFKYNGWGSEFQS